MGFAVLLLAFLSYANAFSMSGSAGICRRVQVQPAGFVTRVNAMRMRQQRRLPVCQAESTAEKRKMIGPASAWQSALQTIGGATLAATLAMPLAAHAAGSGAQDSLVQGMIAGAVAGAAVDLVLYPIDTIKTRLQTDTMKELNLEALPALYSGLIGSLLGHVPSSALFFAIYQTSKVYWLEPAFGQGAVAAQLIASALGNLGASTIRVPTEVVKTRLQVRV